MSTTSASDHRITTVEQLEAIYEQPGAAAVLKEVDYISPQYRSLVDAARFLVIASAGPGGLDASPRGDPAGFVRVCDEKTILIPDRRGNNRIDTLRNLVVDPRIGLIFLIPGVGETLRINGRAEISTEPALLETFKMEGKLPRSVLIVTVERVYYQCSKALIRSQLWDQTAQVPRSSLPSPGDIISALSKDFEKEAFDAFYPKRIKETMY